jgi:hypothetical protein
MNITNNRHSETKITGTIYNEIFDLLIIQMRNYIVLFTLLTFYSAVVFGGLQEVLNIAKCTADIQKELPNSCVYIMKSVREEQGEKKI